MRKVYFNYSWSTLNFIAISHVGGLGAGCGDLPRMFLNNAMWQHGIHPGGKRVGVGNGENLLGKKQEQKSCCCCTQNHCSNDGIFPRAIRPFFFLCYTKASAVNNFLFFFFLTDWKRFWGIGLSERLAWFDSGERSNFDLWLCSKYLNKSRIIRA